MLGTHDLTCVNSLFEQPWWLEAIAPGRWNAVVVRQDGRVVARLPYVVSRRYGFTLVTQPPLTPALGPWFAGGEKRETRRFELEKRWTSELIRQLPDADLFTQTLSPTFTNWLPFYWAGYEGTIRYTYRIADLSDLDAVWANLHEKTRGSIRKAAAELSVRTDLELEQFVALHDATYRRQGLRRPYSDRQIQRLDTACGHRDARKILYAVDEHDRVHAAAYVVWDSGSLYYLMATRNEAFRSSGGMSVVVWEAIKLAAERSLAFDFEGSMVESIERFFRRFGGRQTPLFNVRKARRRIRPLLAARRLSSMRAAS